jgi:ubiquinone/menaquinone biosynthesis C-methylase UbiE
LVTTKPSVNFLVLLGVSMLRSEQSQQVWLREAEFHDALADHLDAATRPPAAPNFWEALLLREAGELRGRQVLEIGCGVGDLTLHLVAAGASRTALDISPRMVEAAKRRTKAWAPTAEAQFLSVPVETTGLEPSQFDLVIGLNILHHVDVHGAAREMARVSRSGARGVFIENSGLNPVLSFARRHLAGRLGIPRYGTLDEHPLTNRDYDQFRRLFRVVAIKYPEFVFFRIFDRQVMRFRSKRISKLLTQMDIATYRVLPALRRFSYKVLLRLEK